MWECTLFILAEDRVKRCSEADEVCKCSLCVCMYVWSCLYVHENEGVWCVCVLLLIRFHSAGLLAPKYFIRSFSLIVISQVRLAYALLTACPKHWWLTAMRFDFSHAGTLWATGCSAVLSLGWQNIYFDCFFFGFEVESGGVTLNSRIPALASLRSWDIGVPLCPRAEHLSRADWKLRALG